MRAETRRPNQPVTWIPQVLELLKFKGHVTSRELARVTGKTLGGDAVTRCRQLGIPLEGIGFVNGSKPPRKLYALNVPFLWFALDEARRQINRYALILNTQDQSAKCPTFNNIAVWIEHVHRMQKMRPKLQHRKKSS